MSHAIQNCKLEMVNTPIIRKEIQFAHLVNVYFDAAQGSARVYILRESERENAIQRLRKIFPNWTITASKISAYCIDIIL